MGDSGIRDAVDRAGRGAGAHGADHPFRDRVDARLESLAVRRIDHEAIETYSNGGRHVTIPDPGGDAIAFAEPPDAA
jgi:hypothetical protein